MYRQRFIIALMAIIMLMTTTVYADELFLCYEEETDNVTYPQGVLKIESNEIPGNTEKLFSLKSAEVMDFEDYIKECLKNHQAEIDVSMYNMKVGNFVAKVSEYSDELMVATGLIDCDAKEISSGVPQAYHTITKWRPVYLFSTQEEDVEARAFVKQEVLKYANDARALTDDPLGQLLLVHDMLVENCEYDVNYKTNSNKEESFSAYGFFKNKIAVCQGYAEAFYLIAKELGYDCGFCVSYSIGHIWNYIKVDNEFYQVDMTWNDPVYNKTTNADGSYTVGYHTTMADHIYFLCSDALMAQRHGTKSTWYQSMDEKPDCGTRFETEYLFNIIDPFTTEFINGKYVVNTTMSRKNNNNTVIFNGTFETDKLHTGAIIPAVATSDDNYCYFLYYFTRPTPWIDLYLGQYEGDKLLTGVKMGTLSNVDEETGNALAIGASGYIFKTGITKEKLTSGCDNIKVFLWEKGLMRPLSFPSGDVLVKADIPTGEIPSGDVPDGEM